jgi:tetratricopeptide (TPR) repeat protein
MLARVRSFEARAFTTFRLLPYDLDAVAGRVALRYALDDEWHFEELVQLTPAASDEGALDERALEGVARLLHVAAGVSYYKTAAPPRITVESGPLGPAAAALGNALYREGLAEFRFAQGLDADVGELFSAGSAPPAAAARAEALQERALVPVGGGKDSVVSIEALRAAGEPLALFSVGDAEPIRRTAEVSGLARLLASRQLSPALFEANELGALNGHVPVTAIVSLIACLAAVRSSYRYVVLSNERSARAGSVRSGAVDVNHQWSKGLEAERLLRAALAQEASPELECFSLLRGASELAIARAFSRLPAYHQAFTSCNQAFRLDPARRRSGWCGDCPKCRFVFLALAPFLDPAPIFGADLLDDERQLPGFLALLGEGAPKPFECVGEVEESLAAFRLLADSERWAQTAVVRAVAERVLARLPAALARPEDVLALGDEHCIPPRFQPVARAALAA